MERKILLYGVTALFMIFAVSGCGTAKKKVNLNEEVSSIKTRVEEIESKIDTVAQRQAEAERASGENAQAIEELKAARERQVLVTNVGIKARSFISHERIKDVQVCLKNAGLYKGRIDGRKGRATRRAIKEFQRMSGLIADGIVGPRTWELLSKYQSATPPAGETEAGATK